MVNICLKSLEGELSTHKQRNNNYMQKLNILGTNIYVGKFDETVAMIGDNVSNLKHKYICVSNVHTTVLGYEDQTYQSIQNNAFLCLPDGKPLCSFQKRKGFKYAERISGTDFMISIIQNYHDAKHYFFGDTPDTLEKMKNNLEKRFGDIKVVGMCPHPFRELSDAEMAVLIESINSSQADFLWVGCGAPRQEIFMNRTCGSIIPLQIGVGAAFSYLSGKSKRAPVFFQKIGLEWLFRLFSNPKKMFKRYFKYNLKWIYLTRIKRR